MLRLPHRQCTGSRRYVRSFPEGGSPSDVVRKHYAKWAKGRQSAIDRLMNEHFATFGDTASVTLQSHEKTAPVN
jgi:hypothetical protein